MKKSKYYLYELDVKMLNIFSLVLMGITLLIAYFINKNFFISSVNYIFSGYHFAIFLILYLLYMVFHEILHSIAYIALGASPKNVLFGAAVEKGVFYCLCKENVTKKNILTSLLTPFALIGILTLIISYIFKLPYLLMLSIFNISGCIGDLFMFSFIRKLDDDIEYSEYDDPVSFGIYSKEDITKIKSFGLKYVGCANVLKREDMKKITVSKPSIVFIVVIVILAVLMFLLDKGII